MKTYDPINDATIQDVADGLLSEATDDQVKTIYNGVVLVVDKGVNNNRWNIQRIEHAYKFRKIRFDKNPDLNKEEWEKPLELSKQVPLGVTAVVYFFNAVGLLTLLPWVVFSMISVMMTDSPANGSSLVVWGAILTVWTYPFWYVSPVVFGSYTLLYKGKSGWAIGVAALALIPAVAYGLFMWS